MSEPRSGAVIGLTLLGLPVLLALTAASDGLSAGPLVPGAGLMGAVWSDHAGLGARYFLLATGLAVGILPRRRGYWSSAVALCCFTLVAAPLLSHWILGSPASLVWRREPWAEGTWATLSAVAGAIALMAALVRQHGPPMALMMAAVLVWLMVFEGGDASVLSHLAGAWHSLFGSGATGPLMYEAVSLFMPLLLFGLALDQMGPRPGRRLWMPALLLAGLFGLVAPFPRLPADWLDSGQAFPWMTLGRQVLDLFSPVANPHLLASLGALGLSLWLTRRPGMSRHLGDLFAFVAAAIATVGFFPMLAWLGWRRSNAATALGRFRDMAALFRRWFGPWLGVAVLIGVAAGPLRLAVAWTLRGTTDFGQGGAIGPISPGLAAAPGLVLTTCLAATAVIASIRGRMSAALWTVLAAGVVAYGTDGTNLQTSLAVATIGAVASGLARPGARSRTRRLVGLGYALQRPTGALIAGLAGFGLAFGLGLRL